MLFATMASGFCFARRSHDIIGVFVMSAMSTSFYKGFTNRKYSVQHLDAQTSRPDGPDPYMANNTASIKPAKVTLPGDASLAALPPLTMLGLIVVREVAKMVAVPVVPEPCETVARCTLVGLLPPVVAGTEKGERSDQGLKSAYEVQTYRCW
jgi:hypothetical protein